MLSTELETCLNEAFQRARERQHEFMTVEHLLLALADLPQVETVLTACGGNVGKLRQQLADHINAESTLMAPDIDGDVQPTLGFQRVLQRAVYDVQSRGKREVTGANVLVAIFSEKQSQAVHFLGIQSISRLDVVNQISHDAPLGSDEYGNEDPLVSSGETSIDGSLGLLVNRQITMGKRLDRIEVLLEQIHRLLVDDEHRRRER